MIPVTESSLTQAADTILHLQSLIDVEWNGFQVPNLVTLGVTS